MKKLLPEIKPLKKPLETLFTILSIVALLSVDGVMAETDKVNWYTVEVISFTRVKTSQVQERWPVSPGFANSTSVASGLDTSEFVPLPVTGAGSLPMPDIVPAPASEKQLGNHAYALNRASGLSVKSHQIWRQQGLPRNLAPWIKLKTESPALTGKVRISLSRYLHADFEIQLQNPEWSPSFSGEAGMNEEMTSKSIPFHVSRKLKRDKIHYIDHPLAGILLRIERFEIPEDLTGSEEADSQISDSANGKSTT